MIDLVRKSARPLMASYFLVVPIVMLARASDLSTQLVKITTSIVIENTGSAPLTSYLIDCDDKEGQVSRLSHIEAKLANALMPVSKTEDGRHWRIDLSSKPVEAGATSQPLVVTKVFTHLELVPSKDVYLVPYSTIHYHVRIIKQGRAHKIKVPSEQYYLEVDNPDLIELDSSTSTVRTFDELGETKIRFVDKNVMSDQDFKQPESLIHIVRASYMTMHVAPGDTWALQKFTNYEIEIRIFDASHHRIYPSDNLDIQIEFPNEIFLTNSSFNGTLHSIRTLKTGPCQIIATFLGTKEAKFDIPVEMIQDLNIYDPLEIKPSAILLPWLPIVKPKYNVQIYAIGSTGTYKWSSNDTHLANIEYDHEDTSVVKIRSQGEGAALITCSDIESSVFTRHALISVTRIAEISVMPSITETEVGGLVYLPVAVYANVSSLVSSQPDADDAESGPNLRLFDDCSQIKFNVEIVEKTRFSYEENEVIPNIRAKSCRSLKFTCHQPGHSRVWISYIDPTNKQAPPLKTTAVIACFKPLKSIYPESLGVLALGTSLELAFEGGPRPFAQRAEDHFTKLELTNDFTVSYVPIIDKYRFNKDLHVFRVVCLQLGDVDVSVSIGNLPSANLPNPASTKATVRISCAKPDSILLKPQLKDSCPLNDIGLSSSNLIPISSQRPTDFEVAIQDDSGRRFSNISSLNFEFSLTGAATLNSYKEVLDDVNAVHGFRKLIRNYITASPKGLEGFGRMRASVKGYKQSVLDSVKISLTKLQIMELALFEEKDIQFVDYAYFNPNKTLIYNHPKNIVTFSIMKGSGHFSIESVLGTKYANVTYIQGSNRVDIVPRSPGKFIIRLEDHCIDINGSPVISDVTVMNAVEFNRELSTNPSSRIMKFCDEIDPAMFCLYLNVIPEPPKPKVVKLATSTTTSTTTTTTTTTTERPRTTLAPPIITKAPAMTAPPINYVEEPRYPPKQQDFPKQQDYQRIDKGARNIGKVEVIQNRETCSNQPAQGQLPPGQCDIRASSSNFFQKLTEYFRFALILISTSIATLFTYKWWISHNKKPTSQFVTDSSFIKQSPSRGSPVSGSPFASTPINARSNRLDYHTGTPSPAQGSASRPRPLYSEKFSTRLTSG